MNITIAPTFGYVEVKRPKYWYENGNIHCITGATIGWDNSDMTHKEAVEMASLGGIALGEKPIEGMK